MNLPTTKLLFYTTPYKTGFDARVIANFKIDNTSWGIILDQTLFYPDSGGQPADKGTLGQARVINVYEEQETIIHVADRNVHKGETVHGTIDWNRRFDHMQQHSGQHILSQCFLELKNGKTVGFHIGRGYSTIDIDCADISEEDLNNIENLANKIVMENRRIMTSVMDKDQLDITSLRKHPSEQNRLRIVSIGNFDKTACCGTHVKSTGEIGLIKITKTENYKGGKRITFKCGWRGIKDYRSKNAIVNEAAKILTSSSSDLVNNIERLRDKHKVEKKRVNQLIQEKADLESRELVNNAEVVHGIRTVTNVFRNRTNSEISILIKKLIQFEKVVVIFGLKEEEPMIFLGRSEDIDVGNIMETASEIIHGKGGGSPFLAQAKGTLSNRIDEAVKQAEKLAKNNINNLQK